MGDHPSQLTEFDAPSFSKRLTVVHSALNAGSDSAACAEVRGRGPTVVAIGKFDGVHRGHGVLLRRVLVEARRHGWQAGVVTFDRHPSEVLKGSRHSYLTSSSERESLCAEAGIDFMLQLQSSYALFAMEANAFAAALIKAVNARMVVVGANFRFGRAAKGDAHTFVNVGRELGAEVVVVPLEEHGGVKVSSTRIRRELAAGRIERVAELLGRQFSIAGTVASVSVRRTAVRISPELALPAPGLYLGRVTYEGEMRRSVPVVIELGVTEGRDKPFELLHLGEAGLQGTPGDACRVVFDRSDPTRLLAAKLLSPEG